MPDDRLARIRQAFDARAADYDESEMHRDLAATVAERLDLDGVTTMLDVATGTGLVLRAVARRDPGVRRLIGVDISREMLRVAQSALPSADWWEADATALDLDDDSVDLITCVTALHILPDVPAALREWARVLRPAGLLVTASFSSAHLTGVERTSHPYPRDHAPYASPGAIATTFAAQGFALDTFWEWTDGVDTVLIAQFRLMAG
ncbi:class I SAM-dependent methyltransferase [Microbacterium sp. GCS4]|uniref:class I SAM-dependent methyltransferase n=1 Tax=Microbacterium sp. GCS4 TaxID=1692239 RepID=UPI0006837AFD|nr:methyltransferase domain-containing protein [Microbacterium sp. GCS4]KNY04444.1 hypothetical protein AKH00_16295 [Microbacterium sp. GCS4]